MAARELGLLRVMGGADEYRLKRLRRVAHGLHVDWPKDEPYRDFVDRLDPAQPRDAAILEEARGVMGHASYLFFDGTPPANAVHAGIAARYAHTTPLRRLCDRYVLDLLAGGGDHDALERLPKTMAEAQTRGGRVEHAVIDLMENEIARAPGRRAVRGNAARGGPARHRHPDRGAAGARPAPRRSPAAAGRAGCRAARPRRPALTVARVQACDELNRSSRRTLGMHSRNTVETPSQPIETHSVSATPTRAATGPARAMPTGISANVAARS